jgi:zinc protease
VKSFFREFYGPQNASLAIVGDFDPAQARALVEQYFGPIPAGAPVKPPSVAQPRLAGVVKETLEDPVAEVPRLDLIWTGPVMFAEDEPAGDVLAEVLAGSEASRLTRSMVHGSRIASRVSAGNQAAGLGGWFQVTAMANSGRAAGDLLPPVQAAIDELRKSGPTAEEVERAKRQFIAARVRGIERIGSRADLLNMYQTYLGDPGWLARDLARYRAVTPAMVQAFAQKYLADDRRIELTTLPKAKVTK